MENSRGRLNRERKTIGLMIEMYCNHFHDSKEQLCEDCSELLKYGNLRLDNCVFGDKKPVCAKCPIHCYKSEMKEKVKKVMRYSGPRMMYTHFVLGIRHLFDRFKKADLSQLKKS